MIGLLLVLVSTTIRQMDSVRMTTLRTAFLMPFSSIASFPKRVFKENSGTEIQRMAISHSGSFQTILRRISAIQTTRVQCALVSIMPFPRILISSGILCINTRILASMITHLIPFYFFYTPVISTRPMLITPSFNTCSGGNSLKPSSEQDISASIRKRILSSYSIFHLPLQFLTSSKEILITPTSIYTPISTSRKM